MKFIFKPAGRLGNALFRYMACSTLCIIYKGEYDVTLHSNIHNKITDIDFNEIITSFNNNNPLIILDNDYVLPDYYIHDNFYKKYKAQIIDFINKNNHTIISTGIFFNVHNPQYYLIKDIINTPTSFNKIYDMVFHVRLGDQVAINWCIPLEKILNLIENIDIGTYHSIALVCDICTTQYEIDFLKNVKEKIQLKFNTSVISESNDVLTDFYIMSNCKTLVCSQSSLSWCAAFFSKTIEKCYMPKTWKYCYYPIDNTELYDI